MNLETWSPWQLWLMLMALVFGAVVALAPWVGKAKVKNKELRQLDMSLEELDHEDSLEEQDGGSHGE